MDSNLQWKKVDGDDTEDKNVGKESMQETAPGSPAGKANAQLTQDAANAAADTSEDQELKDSSPPAKSRPGFHTGL